MKEKNWLKAIGMAIVLLLGTVILSCDKHEIFEPVPQESETTLQLKCATCTLTPGYWKTHSEYGPSSYDDTWSKLSNGANTAFFLSGQSFYAVLWTPPKGNVYYILAHAFIAAQLNDLAGADFEDAQDAFDAAQVLFNTYTPEEASALKGSDKTEWTNLATVLDDYNNGLIGPGHCPDYQFNK